MKTLLSACLIAGSALVAGNTITGSLSNKTIPDGASFFICDIDGKSFTVIGKQANSSLLNTAFTYTDDKHLSPAAVFINAEQQEGNNKTSFYIQPINDDAPSAPLTAHNNLYQRFYITYKAADHNSYNTTTAPGNLEITSIDTVHKVITGKLNCILYNSTKKDWLLITNGRFKLKF